MRTTDWQTGRLEVVPLLFVDDIGSNVQRPLAAVVVGGFFTSAALALVVLPAVYRWLADWMGEQQGVEL